MPFADLDGAAVRKINFPLFPQLDYVDPHSRLSIAHSPIFSESSKKVAKEKVPLIICAGSFYINPPTPPLPPDNDPFFSFAVIHGGVLGYHTLFLFRWLSVVVEDKACRQCS